MFKLSGWGVERGAELSPSVSPRHESLRWQDPDTPLSIWQFGMPEEPSYRLRFTEELVVDVLPAKFIIARTRHEFPQSTIDHFLADQVFPRLIAQAGSLVLHAGAVRLGDGALLLMGESGRGKSTLTASFDQAGLVLLGDDAMVISSTAGRFQVEPVYPSLRLMPDSIDAVMPGAVTAGPVAHYSSKERINVAGDRPSGEATLPVRVIFSIGNATDGVIAVRPMAISEACMTLVENSFALDPSDMAQARRRLEGASSLAAQVPMFEIRYPRDYARLPEVRQAILDQVAVLEPT